MNPNGAVQDHPLAALVVPSIQDLLARLEDLGYFRHELFLRWYPNRLTEQQQQQ